MEERLQLEPGWMSTFVAIHGFKIIYYLLTLISTVFDTYSLWTRSFPVRVTAFLLIANCTLVLLTFFRPLVKKKMYLFLIMLLSLDFFLLIWESYFHLRYLYSDRIYLPAIGILPPFLSFMVLIMLVAWQFRFRMFAAVIILRFLLMVFVITRIGNIAFLPWTVLTVFETASLFVTGGVVYFLVRQMKAQRENLKSLNRQISRQAATAEELAVSWERNRLARELHDTLAHSLSALAVQLEVCRRFFDSDREKARAFLEESHEITVAGLNETRNALKALRSVPLEDLGLVLALRSAASKAAERCGASLKTELPESTVSGLLPQEEQMIYRISQEALENAVRHSGATELILRFSVTSDSFRLEVADNGSGFDVEERKKEKWGLVGMAERAAMVGGKVTILSEKGRGTVVILEKGETGL